VYRDSADRYERRLVRRGHPLDRRRIDVAVEAAGNERRTVELRAPRRPAQALDQFQVVTSDRHDDHHPDLVG
jgi:hypothetical protein